MPMDLTAASDADLVGLARAGDRPAFGMLYLRHHRAAWRVASVVAGWSADAEVALIEGFTTVFSALPADLDPAVDFRRTLLTCVRQAALDRRKTAQRRRVDDSSVSAPADAGPDEVVLSGLEHHLLRSALLALPERRRTALWLTDVEAMTPTEVGGILHLEPAVVTGLAAGAREQVRGACLQVHQRAEVRAACRFTVDHFGSYLDGRLGRSERTLMKAHIDSCPPCRMRRAEFANLAAGLAAVAPVAPLLGGECQQHWRLHAPTGRVTLTLVEPAPAVALPAPLAHRRPRPGAVPLSSLAAAAAAILLLVALPRISPPEGAGPRETVLASPTVRALLTDVPVTPHPISAESTAGSLPVDPAPVDDRGPVADSGPTVVQLVAMSVEPAAPEPAAPPPPTAKPVAPLQVSSLPETMPAGLPAVVTSSPHKNNQKQKQKQKRIEAGADRIAHPGQSRHRGVRA